MLRVRVRVRVRVRTVFRVRGPHRGRGSFGILVGLGGAMRVRVRLSVRQVDWGTATRVKVA